MKYEYEMFRERLDEARSLFMRCIYTYEHGAIAPGLHPSAEPALSLQDGFRAVDTIDAGMQKCESFRLLRCLIYYKQTRLSMSLNRRLKLKHLMQRKGIDCDNGQLKFMNYAPILRAKGAYCVR